MGAPALPGRGRAGDDRLRQLITPEGMPLALTLASRGARAAALIIDLLIIGAATTVTSIALLLIAGGIGLGPALLDQGTDTQARALQALAIVWIIAMFLFRNAYFLFFELGPRGATPGKRITGIRIASRDGGRLTTEAVIARNIVRDIELFLPILFVLSARDDGDTGLATLAGLAWFGVFVLFPFFNRDRLRCGDIIAGSWAVEAPRQRLAQALSVNGAACGPSPATGETYRFGEAELSIYGEYELQVLERMLREGRPEVLREVAQTISRRIGWNAGSGDERAFLEAFYTQLRERLERGLRFGKRKMDKFSRED